MTSAIAGKVARRNAQILYIENERFYVIKTLFFKIYQYPYISLATLPDNKISLYSKGEFPGKINIFVLPLSCHLASSPARWGWLTSHLSGRRKFREPHRWKASPSSLRRPLARLGLLGQGWAVTSRNAQP
jgi:hypothetical protein